MEEYLQQLKPHENEETNDTGYSLYTQVINTYNFIYITEFNQNYNLINQRTNQIKSIIIDEFDHLNDKYIVFCFDETLVIIKEVDIHLIKDYFINNQNSKTYFLQRKIADSLSKIILFNNPSIEDQSFLTQIYYFFHLFIHNDPNIWNKIVRCIIGYFVQKLLNESITDRIQNANSLFQHKNIELQLTEKDYILLNSLGCGNSEVSLIYDEKRKKLFALKYFEDDKLLKREYYNYHAIHHPFFPQYFSHFNTYPSECIVFEFINGNTLSSIEKKKISFKEKIKILFQIMIGIQYLHKNNFVYRDLKPENIIIDQNGTVVIIDFDRIINEFADPEIQASTTEFCSIFTDPKANDLIFSYKFDIYSIGMLIYYIIIEEDPNLNIIDNNQFNNFPHELKKLEELCNRCISIDQNERPDIDQLIIDFYIDFFSKIDDNILHENLLQNLKKDNLIKYFKYMVFISEHNHPESLYKLGQLYRKGKYIIEDGNKAIRYYTLAAEKGHLKSQFILGMIYYNIRYFDQDIKNNTLYIPNLISDASIYQPYHFISSPLYDQYFSNEKEALEMKSIIKTITIRKQIINPNIDKSIYYFSLAAKQNAEAQFILGQIYYQSHLISKHDINKAIHYLTLSANKDFLPAQYVLGAIYFENRFIKSDIKKSIEYFTRIPRKYNIFIDFILGIIHLVFPKNKCDIEKGINYLNLAAKKNIPMMNYYLAQIYENGQFVEKDISKIIQYYTEGANQNDPICQSILGSYYFYGKYVKQDLNKGLYYYNLSAKNNCTDAQYNLGVIYNEGKYLPKNINKAIYYYNLAANQYHVKALHNLGKIYQKNHNTEDMKKAIYYFTLAANFNDDRSQYALGILYMENPLVQNDIQKSIYYFTLAANQNNSLAQFKIGEIYFNGQHIKKDINKAMYYLEAAAKQNDIDAQFNLGKIYYYDPFVKRDINKSIYYFKLAADNNYLPAQYILGTIFFNDKLQHYDIEKSLYYLTMAANQNFLLAQYNLGVLYYIGKLVNRNINRAIYYFSLAANQNNIKAQLVLGQIYIEENNIEKAIYYWSKAADQNSIYAQLNLGRIYFDNIYIKHNIEKSMYYFKLAAKQGNSDAQFYLGQIYFEGKYVVKDINRAIYYYIKSASQNNCIAQNQLSIIYFEGKYVEKDIDKALKYLKLSSDQYFPNAMLFLAKLYLEGKYVEKDIDEALKLFTISANQNYSHSQFILGLIYYNGIYVKQDIKKSIYYLKLAATNNYSESLYTLGIIYYENKYIARNIKESINYLERASKLGHVKAFLQLAIIYHEGKYIDKDIIKAIHYYKEASSLNDAIAKNNLGVIFKNGYEDLIEPNLNLAKEYFKEAIKYNQFGIPMFNLANIIIEENGDKDQIFDYLVKSSLTNFKPSLILLFYLIIKQLKELNLQIIQQIIKKYTDNIKDLYSRIFFLYKEYNKIDLIDEKRNLDKCLESFLKASFYYIDGNAISYEKFEKNIEFYFIDGYFVSIPGFDTNIIQKHSSNYKECNINELFYEGLGKDLDF